MPRRGGSPRTLPRLSPLPCVRPLLHILFRAIIHGLRRQGVAGRGSADAEQSLFSRFYPRAAAATRALARGYPSGTPLTRLWALRAGWASREARCCAQGHRGASSRGRMHRGASLHSGYEVVRVGCRGGAQGDQSGMVRLKKSISGSTCSRLMMALSSSTLAGYSAARSWSSWMSVARL